MTELIPALKRGGCDSSQIAELSDSHLDAYDARSIKAQVVSVEVVDDDGNEVRGPQATTGGFV